MALQDLAVSTSRVPPPAHTFARGFPTAFSTAFSPEKYLITLIISKPLEESRDAASVQPSATPFAFTFFL
eukprot:7286696-Pyramimonas_sp.AAC.1